MTTTTDRPQPAETLAHMWRAYTAEHPSARIRDAAEALGVSEVELLATRCGDGVVRLAGSWPDLVAELHTVGHVMALTRNDVAVHERRGTYNNASASGTMGLVLDEDIDLRIFYSRWHSGFAVESEQRGRILRSLQFFDSDGTAVHKVFLDPTSDDAAYDGIVTRFRSDDQHPVESVSPRPAPDAERPDSEIDVDGFRAAWLALEDTHEFFGMLRTFGVARQQGLRLAPDGHARQVPTSSLAAVLETVAAAATPIMVFVGSPGVIQIHTGLVSRIVRMDEWINVLDPAFNLHVRDSLVTDAWIVRKPTRDGVVTSLELFDAKGSTVALVFGKRKPGIPESEAWRAVVAML